MRNAGASADPPTDPFEAVPLPTRPVRPGARDPRLPPGARPARSPNGSRLPPGVSPDIFGSSGSGGPPGFGGPPGPPGFGGPPGSSGLLPPPAQPPQPWRMAAPPEPRTRDESSGRGGGSGPEGPREEEPPPRRGRGRKPLLAVACVVVLAALAYAVPAFLMSGRVLPGTSVRGVDIGGLSATEAADRLRERLAVRASEEMPLVAAGKRFTIEPGEAGLDLDVAATVDRASSGFPGPAEVWRALTGTTELEPEVTVDRELLTETVEDLAGKIDLRVREGSVTFEDVKPVSVMPRDGRALERQAAAETIAAAFLTAKGEVRLPVTVIKPKVTAATVKKTAARADEALSGR